MAKNKFKLGIVGYGIFKDNPEFEEWYKKKK